MLGYYACSCRKKKVKVNLENLVTPSVNIANKHQFIDLKNLYKPRNLQNMILYRLHHFLYFDGGHF